MKFYVHLICDVFPWNICVYDKCSNYVKTCTHLPQIYGSTTLKANALLLYLPFIFTRNNFWNSHKKGSNLGKLIHDEAFYWCMFFPAMSSDCDSLKNVIILHTLSYHGLCQVFPDFANCTLIQCRHKCKKCSVTCSWGDFYKTNDECFMWQHLIITSKQNPSRRAK